MSIQLVQGTVENVPVTIRDLTGVITTLDGTTPTFDIVTVDPTTDQDDTNKVNGASCDNAGMMLLPLVDTTAGGTWDKGKYRMYVQFVPGDGETPRLGPFDFYLI